ncbi:hypothetical protein [Actinotalea fermentans]|uniref:Uncharacterized protein n=1 Tax=Actinotalea fermentans TaxID=43671 RepID=A0A511YXN6_9CELL|nr:hypothetical protein [Actinotalea fermentans]KGM16505.1 hypothetical protein N867_19550 [Actinotalea fermentans ATCC 43279 = JCM 9966 = DSM 3133]GEN79965.1 hypothetical protein AFE02nite_16990 [Actinotalea fermentans]
MASTRRKAAAAGLAVIGIAGLSLAAAATLDVNSASLSAGSTIVTSCDDAVNLTYTVVGDEVTQVTVNDVDNAAGKCLGQQVGVTVQDVSGGAEQTVVAGSTAYTFTLESAVSVESVVSAAVVIH